jgi:gas vesicle protein
MRDYDDYPRIVIERESGGLGAFVWGALLGAGAALLLAPRTGAETQRELRERARRLRDTAEGRVNEARDSVTGAVERARGEVTDRISAVREVIETRADQARSAVDAGRRAARDARYDLERRVADAKAAYQGGMDPVRDPGATIVEAEVVVTEVVIEDAPDDGLR